MAETPKLIVSDGEIISSPPPTGHGPGTQPGAPPPPPSNLVHNESAKLLATWLNNLGVACITVGAFTPAAAVLYNLGNAAEKVHLGTAAIGVLIYIAVGASLHLAGRRALKELRE